jgi:HSF-type DNA-binding
VLFDFLTGSLSTNLRWFSQSKFSSFQRQLNIYNFKRVTSGKRVLGAVLRISPFVELAEVLTFEIGSCRPRTAYQGRTRTPIIMKNSCAARDFLPLKFRAPRARALDLAVPDRRLKIPTFTICAFSLVATPTSRRLASRTHGTMHCRSPVCHSQRQPVSFLVWDRASSAALEMENSMLCSILLVWASLLRLPCRINLPCSKWHSCYVSNKVFPVCSWDRLC